MSFTKDQILRGVAGKDAEAAMRLKIAPPIMPGALQTCAIAVGVTVSDAIDADTVRLLATAACKYYVAADPSVDVAALGHTLPPNVIETIRIRPGYKIATIRTVGDGTLNISLPQGVVTPYITLSSVAAILESVQVGSLARTASVVGLVGDFTFSLSDDADGKLTIAAGPGLTALLSLAELLNFEANPTLDFTIEADNGVDPVISTSFSLAVGDVGVPVNTVAPTVTGTAQVGATLTKATNGTWTSAVSAVYTFKWYADDVLIPGETAATYVIDAEYEGAVIKVGVTATTPEGAVEAKSVGTAAVIAA